MAFRQHFKFVNWRIRFLMSRTGYSTFYNLNFAKLFSLNCKGVTILTLWWLWPLYCRILSPFLVLLFMKKYCAVLYVIWKLLCHPHRKKAAVKNPKTLLSKWPVFHRWNNCFVHPIFSSFGFWYFGHFSCVIFFPFFVILPILPYKM